MNLQIILTIFLYFDGMIISTLGQPIYETESHVKSTCFQSVSSLELLIKDQQLELNKQKPDIAKQQQRIDDLETRLLKLEQNGPVNQTPGSSAKITTPSQPSTTTPVTTITYPTTTSKLTTTKDCKAILSEGYTQNGVYNLSIDGVTFSAYCDMAGGGWTVLQRRINGRVDFNRTWTDYENGFGDLSADHWLGLKYIHLLTKTKVKIMFDLLMDSSKQNATAVYYDFYVDDKITNYTMHVLPNATYSNEMAKFIDSLNGFFYHNGMQFSTIDIDNDEHSTNCAAYVMNLRGGAYWNKSCYYFGAFNNVFNELYIWYRGAERVAYVQIKVLDY